MLGSSKLCSQVVLGSEARALRLSIDPGEPICLTGMFQEYRELLSVP